MSDHKGGDGAPDETPVPGGVPEWPELREEDELRRVVEARRDSPTVPLAEVLAETRKRER